MEFRKRRVPSPKISDSTDKKDNARRTQPYDEAGGLGYCKTVFIFILLLILGLVIGYYTSPITALAFDGWVDMPLDGNFALNEKLTEGIKLSNLDAPESVVVDEGGNLYAGLQDGRIVKISSSPSIGMGPVEPITSSGIEGAETTDGSAHGRPMGMRLRGKNLYVIDAVYGFYKVNVETKKRTVLVHPSDASPPLKFPNDLDVTSDRKFAYFTDSSSIYTMKSVADVGLMDGSCTGRILRYEFGSKRLQVIAKDFCFGNGIQLTSDEKYVILSETCRTRVKWVELETGKTIRTIPFPMLPDNIRKSRRGTFWIAGANVPTFIGKTFIKSPMLRQAFTGLMPSKLMTLSMYFAFHYQHNFAIEMDEHGRLLRVLQDPSGKLIVGLSQITELEDGRLLLGSYMAPNAAIAKIEK